MPAKKKYVRKNKKGYTATRKFPKKSKLVSKTDRKKIQTVIDENMEDKQAYKYINDVNYNSGINATTDCNFILPNISNSTADNGRIGDQLKAKSFYIMGHIITNLTQNTYSQCRLGVRMIICQPKNYGSQGLIQTGAPTWMAHLLKKGGSVSGFTGAVNDLYSPINSDAIIKYYDKVFYMQTPYVPGTNTGALNVSRMTRFFKIKLRVKRKLLKYDQDIDSGLTPSDYNPVLLLGYAHLDNSTPDTVTTQLNLSWTSIFNYQDA